ncbi:MAG TPA: glycosyltransferase family 2 protein [Candidatus Acidoferrales bacterium]|nr:glycosyltransferase family 2 protein [Candidatus Acidoferrales bacterium]
MIEQAFYVVAGLVLLLALWSLWGGIQWYALARRSRLRPPGFYAPRVALICPCKGFEPGLEQNLVALTEQDYTSFEIFFVLARSDDSAYSVVKFVADSNLPRAHIIIAGKPVDCGEKVNNLRVAVEQLDPTFEVLVFADSDGRPDKHWLEHLVAPLHNPQLGAATSFRWWLPYQGGFWSAFGAAWDAGIATMQGAHNHNFCWGGATAIRRDVFEQVGVRTHWSGALSDDWAMTRALRYAGRRIEFVPECLVPTLRDADFRGLLEFTNRQIIITRVYSPKTWFGGLLYHLLYCASFVLGLILIVQAWIAGELWLTTALILFLVALLVALKGLVRWLAVNELLPAWRHKLQSYAWAWTFLAPLVPILYTWNFLVSLFKRRISWRGVRYRLISPGQTKILSG